MVLRSHQQFNNVQLCLQLKVCDVIYYDKKQVHKNEDEKSCQKTVFTSLFLYVLTFK